MRVVVASVALLLAAGAAPAAAQPAGKATVIKDVVGDANYINDGGEFSFGDTPTATSEPALDLLDVTLSPLKDGRGTITGFTVVANTLAPLRERDQVGLKTRTANCADLLVQYVHSSTATRASLSSGCATDVVPVKATVKGTRLTIVVPFKSMPDKSRTDKLLQTVNVFTQLHLANEPLRGRPVGLLGADTTTANTTYRLR